MRSNRVGFGVATAATAATAAAGGGARRALFLLDDGDLLRFDVVDDDEDEDVVDVDDATESSRTRFFLFDGGLMANICTISKDTGESKTE